MVADIDDRLAPLTNVDVAQLEAARAVIAQAPREAHALEFSVEGDRFVIVRGFASDIVAASDPDVIARHQTVLEKLAALEEAVGQRLDNQAGWRPLPSVIRRLAEAATVAAEDLPRRVSRLYDLSTSLASFVDQDNDLARDTLATDEPLPPDIRRALRDAVATLAVWVRSFPSARAADDEAGAFLNHPERFEDVRRRLPAARTLIETARDLGALSNDDATDAALPIETAERAPRGGVQAEKAAHRGLATGRSLLKAVAGAALAIQLGALGSALETQAPLYGRIVAFALRVPDEIARIARTMPDDLRVAVEEGLRRTREAPAGGMLPGLLPTPLPRSPAVVRDGPPPDFDIEAVKQMILAGEAPPAAWVPFIEHLEFIELPLTNLATVAGLCGLRTLDLNGTRVSDLGPLAAHTALEILSLDRSPVSSLTPLAKLARLRHLSAVNTKVGDTGPLRGLASLRWLDLSRSSVNDLAPLSALAALRTLGLSNTQVSDLEPLAALAALQTLDLRETPVSDLAPLRGLVGLKRLNLTSTQVSDLAPLAGLTALKTLDLSFTLVSDLAPLASLKALQWLDLNSTRVSDLAPLASLTALQTLVLDDVGVSDLGPLATLTALQALYLRSTRVSDLSALSALTSLKVLVLPNDVPLDLSPLAHLPQIEIKHTG